METQGITAADTLTSDEFLALLKNCEWVTGLFDASRQNTQHCIEHELDSCKAALNILRVYEEARSEGMTDVSGTIAKVQAYEHLMRKMAESLGRINYDFDTLD